MRCYLSPIFDTHGAKECRQHRLSRPWCQCRSGCAQWIALRKRRRKRWQSCGRCRWGWPAPSVVSSSARLRPPAKKVMFLLRFDHFAHFLTAGTISLLTSSTARAIFSSARFCVSSHLIIFGKFSLHLWDLHKKHKKKKKLIKIM